MCRLLAVFKITPFELSVAGELLGTAALVYIIVLAIGRLLKRLFSAKLGLLYQIFCISIALFVAIRLFSPRWPIIRDIAAVAILTGTAVAVQLLDQFFWGSFFEQRRKIPIPKFIREVAGALVLVVSALLVLDFDYGVHIPGLVTASGVVGIVLGFALQDSLGNIIAGFALQIGRPFSVGDWLLIENQHVQAVEINWRSSRFITNDEVQLDVPNQHIVKQVVTNFHGGNTRHAMRLEIGVDYDVPPNRVKDVLARAAASTEGVLSDPPPSIFLKNFGDSSVVYEVRFWLDDHRLYNGMADGVRTNIWYALKRHRIKIPYPVRTLQVERTRNTFLEGQSERNAATFDLLRNQPLFKEMEKDHLEYLIKRSHAHHYGRGEYIIHAGAEGSSMFLLLEGEASVSIKTNGRTATVATLHTGDCFGEMSLLTGEKRTASIQASHDCEVLEVTKPTFAELVQKDDELLPRLSELLARRQMETEGFLQNQSTPSSVVAEMTQNYQAGFLNKLRSFFEL